MKTVVRFVVSACASIVLALVLTLPAFAASPHTSGATGQPNQSCQAQPSSPGHAANAPGSAFNPASVSDGVYAGTGHAAGQSGNPNANSNPNAVAQYDVACFQVSH
jgi:hypothetical protein